MHRKVIDQLQGHYSTFEGLFSGIDEDLIHWKPAPKKWSLLEILCHLYDEEREDFRARIIHILGGREGSLPPIDPEAWVEERDYANQDYYSQLSAFLEERKKSMDWLNSLRQPNWQLAYNHPRFGPMSAELFLCNWLAHDLLHIRQIIKLKYQYLKFRFPQTSLKYAGRW